MKKKCTAVIGMVFCCMMMSTIAWAVDCALIKGIFPIVYFHGVGAPGETITIHEPNTFSAFGAICGRTTEPMLGVAINTSLSSFKKGTKVVARLKPAPGSNNTRDIEVVSNGEWEQHVNYMQEFNKH